MKHFTLFKPLLMAVALLVGGGKLCVGSGYDHHDWSAWPDR